MSTNFEKSLNVRHSPYSYREGTIPFGPHSCRHTIGNLGLDHQYDIPRTRTLEQLKNDWSRDVVRDIPNYKCLTWIIEEVPKIDVEYVTV
jgi:hypothetical protein